MVTVIPAQATPRTGPRSIDATPVEMVAPPLRVTPRAAFGAAMPTASSGSANGGTNRCGNTISNALVNGSDNDCVFGPVIELVSGRGHYGRNKEAKGHGYYG